MCLSIYYLSNYVSIYIHTQLYGSCLDAGKLGQSTNFLAVPGRELPHRMDERQETLEVHAASRSEKGLFGATLDPKIKSAIKLNPQAIIASYIQFRMR